MNCERLPGRRASKMALRTSLIAAAVTSILSAAAFAGSNFWNSAGPDGGIIKVIAADPTSSSVVYAGANSGGIWKSTDAGASWKSIGPPATLGKTINAIAISPSLASTVYMAADGSGVWRSTDAGTTWAAANNGIAVTGGADAPTVNSLAVDPGHSTTVYAGADRGESSSDAGMYKTTDGGLHWIQTNSGIVIQVDRAIDLVKFDPNDSTDIFAATADSGVFRSTNSGSTWTKFCDSKLDGQTITDLDPLVYSNTVFAVSDGLYESSSTAPTVITPAVNDFDQEFWVNVSDGLVRLTMHYPRLLTLLMDPDGGAPLNGSPTPPAPRIYVASVDNGMAISTDAAATWNLINNGLPSLDFEALAVDGKDQDVVYTGGQGDGIYKTTNAGTNWAASSHGLQASWVEALAVAASNSSVVYAGLSGVGGLRRSTDGGATWTAANGTPNALGDLSVSSIAIDPTSSSTVFVSAYGYINATDYVDAVYKSTDAGAHWSRSDTGVDPNYPIFALAISRSNGAVLYGVSQSKVYKSTDSGSSWEEQTAATGLIPFPVLLAIDPTSSSTVFVGTYQNGIYRTADGGTTWTNVNNDGGTQNLKFGSIQALAIDPSHPATVYAGVSGNAIWKTTNSGALWTNFTSGLIDIAGSAIVSPESIVVDPSDSTAVYLEAPVDKFGFGDPKVVGVFDSHDAGATWTPMNTGLTTLRSTCIAIARNGARSTLFLGTEGAGVQTFTITQPPKPRQAGGISPIPIRHVGPRP